MGILIGCERVSHEWPGKRVLADQTIGIDEGDRIGIVGTNGDGKSTLLDLVSRRITPDSGTITYRNNITVGMLAQDDALADDDTVCHAVVGDTPEYLWASDPTVRSIIAELLADIDWNGLVGELSGGQRRRCDLARVLIGDWDVLLMDEPTNHLDLHAIRWLAEHLKRRWQPDQGALLVVTHDRWFLDEVCERMWEVHDARIDPFEGGYSAYIQQRVERQRQAAVMEERRQNMLRKELNWLAHGAKARTSKPKFRIDAAMELIANDPPLRNPIELKRMAVGRLGKQVIEMHGVCAATGTTRCCTTSTGSSARRPHRHLGRERRGQDHAAQGDDWRDGAQPGRVKIGKRRSGLACSQHLDVLSEKDDWRVSELLASYKRYLMVDGKPQSPEQMLERLGFDRREFATFVRDLSGGQRRRLSILCVLMQEPNVLVLDEPGNDLDTDMLAVLEDLLDTWPGTLILVSHDRYLMERVTDDQFALIDGTLRHVPGGVDEYLRGCSTRCMTWSSWERASRGAPLPASCRAMTARCCVVEREEDVCCGTSKANSAIVHAGFDAQPGSLMAKLNVEGNRLMYEWAKELNFAVLPVGSLVVCVSEEDAAGLEALLERGQANGVPDLRIIDRDELLQMEPNISDEAVAALWAPTGGIVDPFGLTVALAENAAANGVEFRFNAPVTASSGTATAVGRRRPRTRPSAPVPWSTPRASMPTSAPSTTCQWDVQRGLDRGRRSHRPAQGRVLPARHHRGRPRAPHRLHAAHRHGQGRAREPHGPRQPHRGPHGHRRRGQGGHQHDARGPGRGRLQMLAHGEGRAAARGHHHLRRAARPSGRARLRDRRGRGCAVLL